MEIKFSRTWAMPNHNTFSIKPISDFVERYLVGETVDPFSRDTVLAKYRNDLNPATSAQYHLHALEFISKLIEDGVSADVVLFDPPYSPHQTKECYSGFGINMKYEDDARHGWCKLRMKMADLIRPGGCCLTFGWSTYGIGKKLGFEIEEIMLVSHGIGHNDTICLAERKSSAPKDKGSRETAYNKPQPKMAEQMNLLESAPSGDRSGDK